MRDKFPPITNVDETFAYFESFTNLEKVKLTNRQRSFRLDRIETLLAYFDDPHNNFKSFHIAGTKGKGSTAAMLASILESDGHRTGLYTSPHVSSYLERINVSLLPPEESLLVDQGNHVDTKYILHLGLFVEVVQNHIGNLSPTQLVHHAHPILV